MAVLAALLLALCAAQGLAAQAGPPTVQVSLRLAPADMHVVEGRTELAGRPGPNGSLLFAMEPGRHELVLLAGGYISKTIVVDTAAPEAEAKLERAMSSLRLEREVAVSPRPKSVEYSPDGRFVLAAALSGPGVDLIDAASGLWAGRAEPPAPWAAAQGFVEMAFPPGRDELWVSQMYTDRIHVFSLEDYSWKRAIHSGGSFPKVLLAHPDGRVFVSHWLSWTVCALDAETGTVVGTMRARNTPRGLALSADGSRLYVANFGDGTIEEFDTASYRRTRTLFDGSGGLPAGGNKRHLVLDPDRNRLYASDMGRGSVFVLDLSSYRLLAEIPVGQKTNTIKLSPDGSLLYVSTRGPNNAVDYERKGPAFGELLVIDTRSLAVADRQWGGNQPTGLAVSPDGRQVAFTDFLDHRVEFYRVLSP